MVWSGITPVHLATLSLSLLLKKISVLGLEITDLVLGSL